MLRPTFIKSCFPFFPSRFILSKMGKKKTKKKGNRSDWFRAAFLPSDEVNIPPYRKRREMSRLFLSNEVRSWRRAYGVVMRQLFRVSAVTWPARECCLCRTARPGTRHTHSISHFRHVLSYLLFSLLHFVYIYVALSTPGNLSASLCPFPPGLLSDDDLNTSNKSPG